MQIIEHKSHFAAQCDRCGHTIFLGRRELQDAFERLVGENAYLEFSLGCRCAGEKPVPSHRRTGKTPLKLGTK